MSRELVAEVEQFLFHEARLLDCLQFNEWAALFTEDGRYEVPPTNLPAAEPQTALFLINDDRFRIAERAKRLTKRSAHAEFPASRTCRLVTNVTAQETPDARIEVGCNFVLYRARFGRMDIFPGHSDYRLRREGDLRIEFKRATLALDTLRPHGKVSLIL